MSSPQGASNSMSDEYRPIPLDQLDVSESNVRHREITTDLDGLAENMRILGLQQPIVVQPKGGKFEILIGQRRYYAAKQLGWDTIDARIKKRRLNQFEVRVISFSENVQRRDLSPRDKSDACSYLLEELDTPQAVAQHLGTTVQTVRKWLGYAAVWEGLKKLVDQKIITRPMATRLFQYMPDEDKAVAVALRIAQIRPAKDHRDRIFESLEESPDSSVDAIFRKAEEKKYQKKITFVLPEKWALSMDRAVEHLQMSPSDIARDATIEWLQMLRY